MKHGFEGFSIYVNEHCSTFKNELTTKDSEIFFHLVIIDQISNVTQAFSGTERRGQSEFSLGNPEQHTVTFGGIFFTKIASSMR